MLVSVDEFLAGSPSDGPLEPLSGEFTTYNAADLDIRFLLALARQNHQLSHISCIPNFVLCGSRTQTFVHVRDKCPKSHTYMRIRAGAMVTDLSSSSPKLWLPPNVNEELAQCKGKRFVVCNFGLYNRRDVSVGHSNALIFDTKEHIIERYEPAGKDEYDTAIRKLFHRSMPTWKYMGSSLSSKASQTKESDSFKGMCVTFSLMYVLLRLLNPSANARDVHRYMVSHAPPKTLRREVLRLNRYVADTLRQFERGQLVRRSRVITRQSGKQRKLRCRTLRHHSKRSHDRLKRE